MHSANTDPDFNKKKQEVKINKIYEKINENR